MNRKSKRSLALHVSILLVVMVVLCALLVGLSGYFIYRSDSISDNANRALAIAQSAAAAIDGDAFTTIMSTGEKDDYWHAAKRTLDDIKLRTEVKYLYVLDAQYSDVMTYFAEGYDPVNDIEEEYDFGAEELLVIDGEDTYAEEMFETIRTGRPTVTGTYESGDFGTMVSGFAAIRDAGGRVVGVVGADISLAEVMRAVNSFALRIILIIAGFCVAATLFSLWYITRHIGRPIGALTRASDRMAEGDMDIDLQLGRRDEIGLLAESFNKMAKGTRTQVHLLEKLAEGDLTIQVETRGDKDLMGISLQKTLAQLNAMFQEIRLSSLQVSLGAEQIANGAQHLASGSTQQAATLQQFSAAISDVLQQSQENADKAAEALGETRKAGALMDEGMFSMEQLAASMADINQSSEKIAGVIKVVDDIAFQTNILALNAAVEAARAGQHGKGFAVVADEVRSLAAKSAQAARETAEMIEDNIGRVGEGARLAGSTQQTLKEVGEISAVSAQAMEHISAASGAQNQAISEITVGIGELSGVVQANSATAEQSAASAEEMSSQAQMLNAIVDRFRLEDAPKQLR